MMMKKSDWRISGIGALALIGSACGDNGGLTAGVSASEASTITDASTSTPSPGSMSESESSPTTTMAGTDSEGETVGTTSSPTTEGETLDPPDTTTTTTDPGTTTEDSTSTTEGADTTTDGDDTTGDPVDPDDPDACPLAKMHLPCDANSDDALHAIGLNCTSLGGEWQDNFNAVSVANLDFQAAPPTLGKRAWQVAKSYGTYIDPNTNAPFWSAREGEKVLLISSGLLPAPNAQGAVIIADGDVYNDVAFGGQWDSNTMPPPMSPQHGSPDAMGFTNCDGVNDCSNTLFSQWNLGAGNPDDKMWFSFDVTAPAKANGHLADANGFNFDFAYFSAEFPEWVGDQYNDIFVVWQASEDYTGNVTFINGQPLTVTALWPIDFEGECDWFDPNCTGNDPHLQGTGHLTDGGATGWYKAQGGVKPGETFTLAFSIFDMGDSTYDTTAIIDNWSWDCEGCIPNEVDDCEIVPQ